MNQDNVIALSPCGDSLPDIAAELIAQYLTITHFPYSTVHKGDLLLLAKYNETVPEPDFPDMHSVRAT